MIEKETEAVKELMKVGKKKQAMLALKKKVSIRVNSIPPTKGEGKKSFDITEISRELTREIHTAIRKYPANGLLFTKSRAISLPRFI